MKVLFTDNNYSDINLELSLFRNSGVECVTAQCRTEDDVISAADGCSGLLVQYAPIASRVFEARPEIRIISRIGSGYDNFNIPDAERHGVWVANAPGYGADEVASHALAMALALLRHLPEYDREVRQGAWDFAAVGELRRIGNMTLGIIGLSHIGRRMAQISRHCFKRIVCHDAYCDPASFPEYVERVSLEDVFSQSEVVSLHLSLTPETRGMVNGKLIGLMRPGGIIVNTARGPILDLQALLAALDSGHRAGRGWTCFRRNRPRPIIRR